MSEIKQKTILLVDDEVLVAAGIKPALEKNGYNVLTACTGEEAVETVQKIPEIDLILMDIFPGRGMDGITAAGIILQKRNIPLLFLSSHNDPEIADRTENMTIYGFVLKHASSGLLIASIKTAFKLHESFLRAQHLHEELEGVYEEMQASMEELEATNQELVETQKQLIESEGKYRRLHESMTDAYAMVDLTGRFVESNPAFQEMVQYSGEELLNMNFRELNPPEWKIKEANIINDQLFSRGYTDVYEKEYIRKDGMVIPVELRAYLLHDDQGRRIGIWAIVREITERKRSEDKLRESEERFARAFKSSPAPLVISEIDTGRFIDINDSWVNMLGYSREEQIGRTSGEIGIWFSPEDRERVVRKLYSQGFVREEPINFKTKAGRRVEAFWSAETITLGNEKVMLSLIYDITERRRAEEALRESEMRFSKAFQSNPGPLVITEIDSGRFIDVNDSWISMLEYTRDELIGHSTVELGIWMNPVERKKLVRKFRSRGSLKEELIDFKTKTGGGVRVLWSAETISLGSRKVMLSLMYNITERERAEAALQVSEAFLDSVIVQSPFPVVIFDSTGKIIRFNQALRDQFKTPDKKILIERYNLLHDIQLREQGFMPLIESVFRQGKAARFIVRYDFNNPLSSQPDSPTCLDLDSTLFPIKDAAGNVTHVVAYHLDITGTVRVRKELADTRAMLESAFNQTPVPMVLVSAPDNIIRIANSAVFEFLGLDKELSPVGKSLSDIKISWCDLDMDDRPVSFREMPLVLALQGKTTKNREYSVIRSDGIRRWELVSSAPVYNSAGDLIAAFIAFPDITELKQAEKALRESEERSRNFVEQSPLSIQIFDPSGRIIQVNRAFEEMWGVRFEHLADYNILKDEQMENLGIMDHLLRAFSGDFVDLPPVEFTPILDSITGRKRITHAIAYPVKDSSGAIREVIVINQDITDHRKAEEEKELLQKQLVQAQKMESIGRLAGGVAHDFNNMLGVIIGHSELLMYRPDLPGSFIEGLKEIRMAAERSADLTRQLLAFARKQTVSPEVLDLNDTVEGMLKMLRRLIGEDIDLIWRPGKDTGAVKMDPSQVDQILANLCVNARDAIENTGRITIETATAVFDGTYCSTHPGSVPGEHVILAVSDNGSGMTPETLSHLFEPFFTTKETGKGTGLGLAMIYGIVKQNNGFINVYSEAGCGTTFRIYLPRYRDKAGSTAKEYAEKPEGGHETIMLVEDEPMILEIASTMLEQLGYTVLATSDPGDAVRLAGEHTGGIDLLITDVVMPVMNGRELSEKFMAIYPDIVRLFMSGYTDDVIAHHGVLDEGVYFIQKPFTIKDLAAKVREVFAGK